MGDLCLSGLYRCPANHHGECLGDREAMQAMNLCNKEE